MKNLEKIVNTMRELSENDTTLKITIDLLDSIIYDEEALIEIICQTIKELSQGRVEWDELLETNDEELRENS